MPMDETFFTGYRRNVLQPDDVLVAVHLPFTAENQHFVALKQAKRRDDDIAIVNIAVNVRLAGSENRITHLDVAFGGMAPTTVLAMKSSAKVVGMKWNSQMVEVLNQSLIEELPLSEDAPGGMIGYRRSLTLSLFFKCYLEISNNSSLQIAKNELSGKDSFHTLDHKSTQLFQVIPSLWTLSNSLMLFSLPEKHRDRCHIWSWSALDPQLGIEASSGRGTLLR